MEISACDQTPGSVPRAAFGLHFLPVSLCSGAVTTGMALGTAGSQIPSKLQQCKYPEFTQGQGSTAVDFTSGEERHRGHTESEQGCASHKGGFANISPNSASNA